MARVLVVPDLHCPWDHPKAKDFLCRMQDKFKPDRVVCLGDEVDLHAFSARWPVNPELHSASRELELAKESLQRYYKDLPHVDVIESNHGMRIFKKNMVTGMPKMVLKRYEEILGFVKGWKLIGDHLIVDNVLYIHGEGITSGSWTIAHQKFKSSVVMGHLHSRAGVFYSQTKRAKHFAMNTGCLIFPTADAFSYGQHSVEKPVLGAGIVIDGEQALFVRMNDSGKMLL